MIELPTLKSDSAKNRFLLSNFIAVSLRLDATIKLSLSSTSSPERKMNLSATGKISTCIPAVSTSVIVALTGSEILNESSCEGTNSISRNAVTLKNISPVMSNSFSNCPEL